MPDHHTYTLNQQPYVDPFLTQGVLDETVTVTEPRSLTVCGSTLTLNADEPDLPVGEQVRVWRDRLFHCEAVAAQAQRDKDAEALQALLERQDTQAREHAEMAYLRSAKHLVSTNYPLDKAQRFLETYWGAQSHFQEELSFYARFEDAVMSRKAREIRINLSVIDQCLALIYRDLMAKLEAKAGVTLVNAYAYSPREGGQTGHHSPGKGHIMVESGELKRGRLKRVERDALCKPSKHFWGLEPQEGVVTCQICVKRLLGLLSK